MRRGGKAVVVFFFFWVAPPPQKSPKSPKWIWGRSQPRSCCCCQSRPCPSPPPGLLRDLGGALGGEGLSPPLQLQLQQAERSLGRARGLWLRQELLWRLVGELLRDPRNLEPQVLQSLERRLPRARLRRGPQSGWGLLPPPEPPQILPGLLPELQRRLRGKREELGDFLLGSPKIPPNLPNLGKILRAQRLRLLRERLRERLLREKLERIRREYPEALSRCRALLSQLCSLRQLQAHLDEGRGRYLQARGGATLLKSRLEELRVLLDTYPAPTVEAHRRIRALLSESRGAAEAEAAILGAELAALRALGPEFRRLALELGRLRQEAARRRWALGQLRPPAP